MSSVCRRSRRSSLAVWAVAGVCARARSRRCASAPIRTTCRSRTNAARASRTGSPTLVARDLDRPLEYFWLPQRRGFIRNSLNAGRCDVVMGVPAQYGLLQPTQQLLPIVLRVRLAPRSAPAHRFVRRAALQDADDRHPDHRRRLQQSAGRAGARRRGTSCRTCADSPIYGDYSQPDPQRDIVDAVADGRVDVAVVWGPLAGYYAQREPTPLDVRPVAAPSSDAPSRFTFDIAMGVRRDDTRAASRARRRHRAARRRDAADPACVRSAAPMMRQSWSRRSLLCVVLARVRRPAAARRRDRSAAADRHGGRPDSGSADVVRRAPRIRTPTIARRWEKGASSSSGSTVPAVTADAPVAAWGRACATSTGSTATTTRSCSARSPRDARTACRRGRRA